jgi:hypothetical protein
LSVCGPFYYEASIANAADLSVAVRAIELPTTPTGNQSFFNDNRNLYMIENSVVYSLTDNLWTRKSRIPQVISSNQLNAVYGDGVIVVAGGNELFFTKVDDLSTWIAIGNWPRDLSRYPLASWTLNFNDGKFLILGGTSITNDLLTIPIYQSEDGVKWEDTDIVIPLNLLSGGDYFKYITYKDGNYLLVGNGSALRSKGFRGKWEVVKVGKAVSRFDPTSVTYGSGGILVTTVSTPTYWSSIDQGGTWREFRTPESSFLGCSSYLNGSFISVGQLGVEGNRPSKLFASANISGGVWDSADLGERVINGCTFYFASSNPNLLYMTGYLGGSGTSSSDLRLFEIRINTASKTTATPMPSKTQTTSPQSSQKPSTPTFSAVTFSGNKININVNLGSSSNRPEKVYLVAPKLGFTSANPNQGTISGNSATWSLDLNSLLGGTAIPLEIVGEKDGVKSDSLIGTYQVPGSTKATSIPAAPTKYTSRIVGTSVLITVQVGTNAKSAPSEALLFSKSLGIAWPKTISGDIAGSKAIFEIPLKSSMAGKKYPLTIYLTNSIGESKPLNAILSIPAAPKKPTIPTALPQPQVPETVICVRANQTRTFTGDTCPTGWSKK